MKTRLHLCGKNSQESFFNHLVSDDVNVEIDDILDYNNYHIHLDTDGLKAFNFLKLYIGNHKVKEVWYSIEDRNEKIRNILLTPLTNY